MKTSTAIGIGVGTFAVLGLGALALRKPRRNGSRRRGGNGQQGGGAGDAGGDWPRGETRDFPFKGCLGQMTHLPAPDEMGNNFFWSVTKGGSGDLVASGTAKSGHVARTQMWEALRWHICQQADPSRLPPEGA